MKLANSRIWSIVFEKVLGTAWTLISHSQWRLPFVNVIFGHQENGKDQQEVEELVNDIGVVANVSVVYRVGVAVKKKPRTLVVRFETEKNREDVYNNLRNLKGKSRWNRISVTPDWTKVQCIEEKLT